MTKEEAKELIADINARYIIPANYAISLYRIKKDDYGISLSIREQQKNIGDLTEWHTFFRSADKEKILSMCSITFKPKQ